MRFRHLFLLPPLALALVSTTFGGCNTEEELDNLCLFLKDQESCYQDFLTTIGDECTMDVVGSFDVADVLERCTVSGSNIPEDVVTQVNFDPPIEIAKLPYTGGSVKMLINGTQCGTIEIGESEKLAVALDVYPPLTDPTAACEMSGTQFCGSSYSNTPLPPEAADDPKERMSTKCPDGTTFTFDRLQVGQQCADQEAFIPKAKLVIIPSGVANEDGTGGKKGSVQLSIQYTPEATRMYVNCEIPPALPPCANGVKDGSETDVDCGGSVCTTRCTADQACISGSDCDKGVCTVTMGIKKCAM